MTDEAQPTTMFGALLEAQRAISGVGKDATNTYHKFDYTSAEAMIGACRKALIDNGLLAVRRDWKIGELMGSNGERMLTAEFVLHHPDSGTEYADTVQWPIVPEKGRPLDKAAAVALTTAMNYWLRDLLMVPRSEETMDDRDDTAHQPPAVVDAETVTTLQQLCDEAGSNPTHVANYFHAASLDQMPASDAPKAVNLLRNRIERNKEKAQADADAADAQGAESATAE